MTFSPERIVRSHIKPIATYAPGVSPVDDPAAIRLDWNESPFGLSPQAQAVYRAYGTGNRYPTIDQHDLVAALARYIGVSADRVIAGAGLDDVFTTLAIATIETGDEVIISDPTFGLYRSLFELHGATVLDVPLGSAPDFSLDVDGIIAAANARTKLVIICNPNNPTGTLYGKDDIARIIAKVDCLVAIDEAYAEFSGASHLDLANRYPNVALFRTLSKFAGLAGYRVGYGVFPDALIPWIRRAAPAFLNVSAISAAIAVASLHDLDHLHANVDILIHERERMIEEMNNLPGVVAFDSAANFILFRLPMEETKAVTDHLESRKVYVRHYGGFLANCLRVSVGLPRENTVFLDALREALAQEPISLMASGTGGAHS
ncbi:MAG: histidinol-phosphate transaminase [Chloroflexota bacterium]|nr:histidinol-phosphate transaminase [Chloroflexota bacterium]